jgi:hypothetical protein
MVASRQGLPKGPGMPFWFSLGEIAPGLNPSGKVRNMPWTAVASLQVER